MTDTTQIQQAVVIIDDGLAAYSKRSLLSSEEVSDVLLDLRALLTFLPAEPDQQATN